MSDTMQQARLQFDAAAAVNELVAIALAGIPPAYSLQAAAARGKDCLTWGMVVGLFDLGIHRKLGTI